MSIWTPALDSCGTPASKVKFARRNCQPCSHRVDCAGPQASHRLISLRPQARHEALAQARQRQDTAAFARMYAQRAGFYAGLAKVRLQHAATAAALNLARTVRWLAGKPIATTRQNQFGRLFTALATA